MNGRLGGGNGPLSSGLGNMQMRSAACALGGLWVIHLWVPVVGDV